MEAAWSSKMLVSYMVSQPRRPQLESSLPCKSQILNQGLHMVHVLEGYYKGIMGVIGRLKISSFRVKL
jgi:hypothetical protein